MKFFAVIKIKNFINIDCKRSEKFNERLCGKLRKNRIARFSKSELCLRESVCYSVGSQCIGL